MTVKPIIFSAPMVRALLDGRKTQTRRVLKPQPPSWCYQDQKPGYSILTPKGHIEFRGRYVDAAGVDHGPASKFIKLPYAPGDLLWVRENFVTTGSGPIRYAATDDIHELRKVKPSIHMPRWASRLTLRVTEVRVERVQSISAADSIAESVECETCTAMGSSACKRLGCFASLTAFKRLWDSLNAKRGHGWAENPWVAAVTFEVIKANVDTLQEPAP